MILSRLFWTSVLFYLRPVHLYFLHDDRLLLLRLLSASPIFSFSPCTTAYCKEKNIAHTHSTDRCYKLHPQNGKGGKGSKGSSSLLFTKGRKGSPKGKGKSKGKGKGKPGKGKGDRKGKRPKGKDTRGLGRSLDDTCHFCKQPGHYKAQCPKFTALSSKTSYGRIRAKLSEEKVYVYDLLEDSVNEEVCWNCLCHECDWATCATPVEALLFHDASKQFVEDGMWDMVSSAKSSNPPLTCGKYFYKSVVQRMIAGRMMRMATKTIGVKTTSRMKTADYPAICQEQNRSLSFTLSIDS